MSVNETFCLKWNDFEGNISTAFRELRDDKDFFDVTLACDDEQIQAHKVILAACSSFFRNILKRNRHEHPLLYLKGVKYTDLLAVLNFMYHGEVNVAQEQLNVFLTIAEELKVKGLTQTVGQETISKAKEDKTFNSPTSYVKRDPPDREQTPRETKRVRVPDVPPKDYTTNIISNEVEEVAIVKQEEVVSREETEPAQTDMYEDNNYEDYDENYGGNDYNDTSTSLMTPPNATGSKGNDGFLNFSPDSMNVCNNEELEKLLESMMEKSFGFWSCVQCGKTSKLKNDVRRHIEAKHVEGVYHSCNLCGKQFRSRDVLRKHAVRCTPKFSS